MSRPALLALALALVACESSDRGPKWKPAGATTPRIGGTLRFAINQRIATLDPTIAYDEYATFALHSLFDTLLDYAPGSYELVPRLAESWQVSTDGTVYRFRLRGNLTYQDGSPIVAGDLAFSLERARTTPDSPFGPFLADVTAITMPSDRDLVITLAQPNAAFAYVLTMPFTTPQRRQHVTAAGDQLRRTPLASGPYQLERWDEGQQLVLVRRAQYHSLDRGYLERIVMRENVPRDTQFLMFERGELDAAEKLAAPDYLWLLEQKAWAPYLHSRAMMNAFGSRMNVRVKPFDDRRVRQALNYALDKSSTHKLLNATTVPAHGLLPPDMLGRDPTLAPYPHDPAKARALLAEAGYADGLDLEYVTVPDDETEKLAASLQGDLAAVGIRLRISLVSWSTYVSTVGMKNGPPFSFTSWTGDYPDPTNFLDTRFHSRAISDESSTNDSFYANPELDGILDTARGELDPAKRAALYRRAERILYDDAPWIWDYHRVTTEVTQPYVRGFDQHPVWLRDYTAAWLDVGPDGTPVPR